jgi:hypothetical protein
MKEEETCYEHQEDYGTCHDVEVSPTHILAFVATCFAGSCDVAREKRGFTRILGVGKEAPCDWKG